MSDSERPRRSRFDQTEPEPKRASRFDRRSRSPTQRDSRDRERSPLNQDNGAESKGPAADPAAAAAAAAARINAQLQARKGIQHVDVPPIQSNDGQPPVRPPPPSGDANNGKPAIHGEMYVSGGDYIQDIEINDLRNRYLVAKASTQQMIMKESGADITTRGSYYPNKSMATAANPPLYLHVTSTTKAGLEAAVAKINEMMQQELPQLVDERRFQRRDQQQQQQVENQDRGRRKWPEEKIPIDLEPVRGFNLRAQIVGQGGSYVKHIQNETRCRVQIKGRGSGFLERETNQESDEPMFLHVTGPEIEMVEKGKELCQDLVANVKEQYEEFKNRPPRDDRGGYGGDRRDRNYDGGDSYRGGGYGRDSNNGGYGGDASRGADSGASNADAADLAAQYAQYYHANPEADPYAAYGGYAAYAAYYQQYYAQYQAQAEGQAAGGAPLPPPVDSAPPPPPSDSQPPPPPGGGSGSYGAVPPPPGL